MKKIIIGLGSKAQIGKDYAAAQLKQYFDVERIAFADELKNDLKYLFKQNNLDLDMINSEPELKKVIRPLYVAYGHTMREFNENLWVDRALKDRELNHQVTIITDVRYPNEAKRLKELGGTYIEIETNIPPANEVEALYSPLMGGEADFVVRNNFDGKFVSDMVDLITILLKQDEHSKD